MSVEVDSTRFVQQMRKYAAIYGERHNKGMGEIVLERAKKLAFQLYKETKAVAPTASDIATDVTKQGWKIPTKFPDGRLGRGTPDQWKGNAVASLPKRRGRKSKARIAEEGAISSRKATLGMMQAFVIKHRSAHIGFVASGWLSALSSLEGGSGNWKGSTEFHEGFFHLSGSVWIINRAPGCIAVNAKHGVMRKAVEQQTADMAQYIADRMHQELKAA